MLGGRTRAALTGVLVVLLTLGAGSGVGAASGRTVPAAAAHAPGTARASGGLAVPTGFPERVGYRPQAEQLPDGPRLTRPDGGCSSPWGGTRYGFDAACRAHDLGYDLIRDAAATGRPYAGAARLRVDTRMVLDMAGVCGADPVCLGVAAVYGGAVLLNSTTEAFSVPAPRSLHRVLVPVAGSLLVLAGWLLLVRQRRWTCTAPASLALGLAAAAGSWQPSMLPRTAGAQLLVTGLSTLSALALGGAVTWAWGRAARRRPGWGVGPVGGALLAGALLVGATAGHAGQVQQAVPMGVAPITLWQSVLAGLVGAALAVAAALAPGVAVRAVVAARRARRLSRRAGGVPRHAWVVGAVVVLLLPGLSGGPDRSAAAQPLGERQQQFLGGARGGAEIAEVTGRDAHDPVRVAVPVGAGDATSRAREAVSRLVEADGLDRRVVLVALPTGSGWVNPAAVGALELLTDGDVATVTVQYDDRPSYQSFLSGGGARATEQAAALLDALDLALQEHDGPAPRVVVYGESLGAVGGLPVQDHAVVDGTVWVGVPHAARALLRATGTETGHLVENADDPVTAWSPRLALVPTERWRARWVPLVSFWAGTADLVASLDQPDGHGHRYGAELVAALDAAASCEGGTSTLRAVRVAVAGGG